MFRVSLKPGEWYIAVVCTNCKTLIPVFSDLNEGKATVLGSFYMACPRCKHTASFDAQHYLHQEETEEFGKMPERQLGLKRRQRVGR